MRSELQAQETTIATVARYVNVWRLREGWSRETVVEQIVDAHERINGPLVTDIRFEPNSSDTFKRMKANADRVFRWMDDLSKDNNLLPANFLPSLIAALPEDLRLHCLTDMLRPTGCSVRLTCVDSATAFEPGKSIRRLIKENSEAQQAVVTLVDGATLPELQNARKELGESLSETKKALAEVEAELFRRGE